MMSAGMSGVAGGVSVGLVMSMTVIEALVARSDVSVSEESAVMVKVVVSVKVSGDTGGLSVEEGETGGLTGVGLSALMRDMGECMGQILRRVVSIAVSGVVVSAVSEVVSVVSVMSGESNPGAVFGRRNPVVSVM